MMTKHTSDEISEKKNLPDDNLRMEEHTETSNSEGNKVRWLNALKNPTILRIGIYATTFIAAILIMWGVGILIVNETQASPELTLTPNQPTIALPDDLSTPIFSAEEGSGGLVRQPEINTTLSPSVETRNEVLTYVVEKGDTIFGIADKFGLKPESVLWSNYYTLGDTPDGLSIGQELLIFPSDGTVYVWNEGDGLNGVSKFYGVTPEDIINYPGNNLEPDTIGDYANPNIEPGTMLFVPGGTRQVISWINARDEEASGNSYLGDGACTVSIYSQSGTGTFTWPTTATWLSGYDYTPPTHNGLDFDGDFGSPIYAADAGVIVYSGWSDRGYGNLIVVDHDRGFETYYAHLLDGTMLPCGTNVQKGQLIASMGSTGNSTGPHLHFELRLYGSPQNPWLYLN